MKSFVSFWQHTSLLVVRLVLGFLLLTHAWHRWSVVGMPAEIQHLQAHHVPQPYLMAWGSVVLELLGGVMLFFGVLVPLVALALMVQQLLVIVWIKWRNGLLPHADGFENNLLLALLALLLFTYGSGRAGLDSFIFRRHREDPERRVVREVP
ncbi:MULTISPECIES: DoxX family protein [unclassified Luteococcus]|uniref:DoxX family protein n=1 Tax=unclassified Luteococcus TaxID=2639923 RepID=UPI00313C1625